MIALRVLKPFGVWNAGETAGFPLERAAELVAQGFAERVAPAVAEAPAQVLAEVPAEVPEADEGEEPAPARRRKA